MLSFLASLVGVGLTPVKDELIPPSQSEHQSPQSQPPISNDLDEDVSSSPVNLKIYYSTVGLTSKKLAENLKVRIVEGTMAAASATATTTKSLPINISVLNIQELDVDELHNETVPCILVMSTYEEGKPAPDGQYFYDWLEDVRNDFRVGKQFLQKLKYAVFCIGDSAYKEHFCGVGKVVDDHLRGLSAKRMTKLTLGDYSDAENSIENQFDRFSNSMIQYFSSKSSKSTSKSKTKSITIEEKVVMEEEEEEDYVDEEDDEYDSTLADFQQQATASSKQELDLEDLGKMAAKLTKTRAEAANDMDALDPDSIAKLSIGEGLVAVKRKKEMVTPPLRAALEKQGYKIVGTHSGVKICRWTKSMLRGRGGCYKHSFYGIDSHRCMESTPSLACANKCVFCWRHGTNPVGTEWKWETDSAETVLEGVLEQHYKMINTLKGLPGLKPERYTEAMQVKHAALSLVGEPIMFPHISRFIELLHEKKISSFLVTNAQFPDQLRALGPVTQLYVSIDASTKDSLKKVDRPLFKDFWERFLACIDVLKEKKQRTVYRLTLVKEFNTEEIKQYAELIRRGSPDLIEVKGVTYCGVDKNGVAKISMSNVPFHREVVAFVKVLMEELSSGGGEDDVGEEYGIASEHEHSVSLLMAKKTFYKQGKWHTWIDYDRFQELVALGQPFTSLDYMAETPAWATYGSNEKGFDPEESRYKRNKPVEI